MKITPIEAFEDNYIWLVEGGDKAFIVDPGESEAVLNELETKRLDLTAILLTHQHADHVDGVAEILQKYPGTPVYGPSEVNELADHTLKEGDEFELLGHLISVLKTAGHTEEHISYLMDEHLFSGDALFSAGCGRVFTGDYQAQFDALQKFKHLNDTVKVYAGHEYTLANLKFAKEVMPKSEAVEEALEEVKQSRASGQPSLPTTIAREKQINPFLRAEDVETFTELRKKKDNS